ncbi:hypothetical protein V6R21_13095 [Limibacter armeniacum]|uniref:hypothetical protein n=1 Tax=Limibacter armeniacum TaxID=466084 RepID=UPI002FE5B033
MISFKATTFSRQGYWMYLLKQWGSRVLLCAAGIAIYRHVYLEEPFNLGRLFAASIFLISFPYLRHDRIEEVVINDDLKRIKLVYYRLIFGKDECSFSFDESRIKVKTDKESFKIEFGIKQGQKFILKQAKDGFTIETLSKLLDELKNRQLVLIPDDDAS